jgi:hypothetical protein
MPSGPNTARRHAREAALPARRPPCPESVGDRRANRRADADAEELLDERRREHLRGDFHERVGDRLKRVDEQVAPARDRLLRLVELRGRCGDLAAQLVDPRVHLARALRARNGEELGQLLLCRLEIARQRFDLRAVLRADLGQSLEESRDGVSRRATRGLLELKQRVARFRDLGVELRDLRRERVDLGQRLGIATGQFLACASRSGIDCAMASRSEVSARTISSWAWRVVIAWIASSEFTRAI